MELTTQPTRRKGWPTNEPLPLPLPRADVEWTEERERHTTERHPDFLPEYRDKVPATLAEPDEVRRSRRFGNARLFSRWFDDLHDGKRVVVVVVSDPAPSERHWVITAYIARRLTQGESEWTRPS